jgi:hypothetical protein
MAPVDEARLDKISQGQPGVWRTVFNRRNIAGIAGAALLGPGLQLGRTGAVAGFFLVRWVYCKTEQYVPFTKRRHIVLLPSVAGGSVHSLNSRALPASTCMLLHQHVRIGLCTCSFEALQLLHWANHYVCFYLSLTRDIRSLHRQHEMCSAAVQG